MTFNEETTDHSFAYDVFGNTTEIKAGNYTLAQYDYNDIGTRVEKVTYGNGFTVEYTYDLLDRLSEVWYTVGESRSLAYKYYYTSDGQLSHIEDKRLGVSTRYTYDADGRVVDMIQTSDVNTGSGVNEDILLYAKYTYASVHDGEARLSQSTHRIDLSSTLGSSSVYTYTNYTYAGDGRISVISNGGAGSSGSVRYYYNDGLERLTSKVFNGKQTGSTASFTNTTSYEYLTKVSGAETYTSCLVSKYTTKVNSNTANVYSYTYDSRGNITSIKINNVEKYRYVYDSKNQLVREDNIPLNKTIVYNYDSAGNITSKKTYSLTAAGTTPSGTVQTKSYTYGDSTWGDKLTAYNGTSITYDEIGNPLSYYNGSSYTFTWEGRRLVGATKGSTVMSFTYNEDGLRTSKTVNGVTTEYIYDGSLLLCERNPNYVMFFYYDAEGSPVGFDYKDLTSSTSSYESYFYVKNLQGDVTDVYSSDGVLLMHYDHYAFCSYSGNYYNGGENTHANKNPFHARGYYYDQDLGMYYLQSRYYDSTIGRFINADGYVSTGQGLLGYNMYAYCGNNPVMYVDQTGASFKSFLNDLNNLINDFHDWLNKYALNKDGTYSLYDNDRFHDYNPWHEQIFAASGSKPSLDFKEGNLGLGSLALDFYTGGWEWKYANLSLFDIGHAEASAEVKNRSINVGAFASAWSPSFSVTIFDVEIKLGAEIGAIGGSLDIGNGKFSAKGAYGWGLSLTIDW